VIQLPAGDPFVHENNFYLSAQPGRIGKLLAQYELFKRTLEVPGAIVECGVFKGASFVRWAMLRALFCDPMAKELIGFDTFTTYATTDAIFQGRDKALRNAVVAAAGDECIGLSDLLGVLHTKGCHQNVNLLAGKVEETIPRFVDERPEVRISLLNIDLDFYSGSRIAIENLWPRVAVGGIMILDDYGVFEGESMAVEELLPGAKIKHFPFAYSPSYLEKTP
jgi:hypothetical protein